MRITSCHIGAFGCFEERTFDELDHPVVVVQGGNEAGKTTFFHFLRTMFYGIYPTDAGKHPYAPRSGRTLWGTLDFRLDSGQEGSVRRRLLSAPRGRLVRGTEETTLRNRTIPALEHIPRIVFSSVYALHHRDLVRLDGMAWDEVQDRLLGGLSINHIRPARVVIEELDGEATDLWRSDNRGRPEAKKLKKRRRRLREAAKVARERDTRLRQLHEAVARHEERLETLQDEQVELRAHLNRVERLVPVRKLLEQIEVLEERAGDLSPYEILPEDPPPRLDEQADEIEDLEIRLQKKRHALDRLEGAIEAFTEKDEQVLEHASAVRTWTKQVEAHQNLLNDVEQARQHRKQVRADLEKAAWVFSESWNDGMAEPLRTLSIAALRKRVKAFEEAERRLREMRARAETLGFHAEARKSPLPWGVVAALGVVLAGAEVAMQLPVPGVTEAGVALAVVGLFQAYAAWSYNQKLDWQDEKLGLPELRQKAKACAGRVAALLEELPLPSERLEHPDRDLVHDLGRMKAVLDEYESCSRLADTLAKEIVEAHQDVQKLAEQCGLPEDEIGDAVVNMVSRLEERLEQARERKKEADRAAAELPELRSEVETLAHTLSDLRSRHETMTGLLEDLGKGDRATGIEELAERRTAARRADVARDHLHAEYPDWKDRQAQIETLDDEERWTYTAEEQARMEQRLEAVEAAIHEHDKARTAKKKDIEHLSEERTIGDIESELAHVNRRLAEVRQHRDRLKLLANIVRRADHTFRMKHQPDVIKRASAYLRRITDGRYERLMVEEDGTRLRVYEQEHSFAHAAESPISQGTRDQIYLALRLAILDHLDADQEHLPIILDEAFVNWDAKRRGRAFEILSEMAETRQVFLFTCHPFFARRAVQRLNGHQVELDALRTPARLNGL